MATTDVTNIRIEYKLCENKDHVFFNIVTPEIGDNPTSNVYFEQELLAKLSVPDHPLAKYADYQNASIRADLLIEFMGVDNADKLLDYLNKYGVPDFDWAVSPQPPEKFFHFPVRRFLSTAATLHWLFIFLDAVQNNLYPTIRNWLNIKQEGENVLVEFKPTPMEREGELKHWTGFQTLTEERYETAIITVSAKKWNDNPKVITMDCAKNYLQTYISQLVSKIRLSLDAWQKDNTFGQRMGCSTPYQAICLALYEKATGAPYIRKCDNPNCPTPFYVPKGGKKRRSDRSFCGRPGCQKYVYNHPEIIPSRSRRKKKKESV